MTIAACYVSPEGVVFGADSTTTVLTRKGRANSGDEHFFNYGQKVFEVGDGATFGIVTWGLGAFPNTSYRMLYAEVGDDLKGKPPATVEEAARRWSERFWAEYEREVATPHQKAVATAKSAKRKAASGTLERINSVGFCIGGVALPNRRPAAYELNFSPTAVAAPVPVAVPPERAIFRGVPMLIDRMLYGLDPKLFDLITASPNWKGGSPELYKLVGQFVLGQPPRLPMREAIDWIFSCIQSTIKGVKFSPYRPICGGPVEIAVVTSDRSFRWVRHKTLDAAVREGETETHKEAV